MKYIVEEKKGKILLSTYLKKLETSLYGKHFLQDKYDISYLKHLISLFGDIELEKSLVKEFISFYSRSGGRFFVLSEDDTFKGLLELKKRYPYLSTEAIKDISYLYIKDLFDKYSLDEVIDEYLSKYGKTDEAIEKYIIYVDQLEEKEQEKYIEDSKLIKEELLSLGYDDGYADYLAFLVKRKHYDMDDILSHLPDSELVKEDRKQLLDIATKTRIFFGAGIPISFKLTQDIIKDSELSNYPEEFIYTATIGDFKKNYPATFTKSEFIESTKRKQKTK